MVKTDSKRLNVRLKTAAKYALEDLAEQWDCSQTAALERAILEAHERLSQTHDRKVSELKVEYDE